MPIGVYPRTEYHRRINSLSRKGIHKPVGERLLEHIISKKDCWLTNLTKDKRGYARISEYRKGPVLAHRVAFEYFNKSKIPIGMCVLHKCDNPLCINPEHLYLGTKSANGQDMHDRKRVEGSKNGFSKLTEADVLKIRELHGKKLSYLKLGKLYNVTFSNIAHIIKRRRWDHI